MKIRKAFLGLIFLPLVLSGCTSDLSDRKIYQEKKNEFLEDTYKLKAITITEELSFNGTFVLMVGSVSGSEDPYYIFYVQKPGGGIKLIKSLYYDVVIYEENIASSSAKAEHFSFAPADRIEQHWVLTVPLGTVKEVLDLDLSKLE